MNAVNDWRPYLHGDLTYRSVILWLAVLTRRQLPNQVNIVVSAGTSYLKGTALFVLVSDYVC